MRQVFPRRHKTIYTRDLARAERELDVAKQQLNDAQEAVDDARQHRDCALHEFWAEFEARITPGDIVRYDDGCNIGIYKHHDKWHATIGNVGIPVVLSNTFEIVDEDTHFGLSMFGDRRSK